MVEEDDTRYWESAGAARKQFVLEYSLFLIAKHYGCKGQKQPADICSEIHKPKSGLRVLGSLEPPETKSEQGGGFWLTVGPSFAIRTDSQK